MESVIKKLRKAFASAVLTAAMLVPAAAMAQTGTLRGTVTDEADEPIAGAVISDSNSKYTAMTDADGNFTISSVPYNTEIKCNFLGYRPHRRCGSHRLRTAVETALPQPVDRVAGCYPRSGNNP